MSDKGKIMATGMNSAADSMDDSDQGDVKISKEARAAAETLAKAFGQAGASTAFPPSRARGITPASPRRT